MLAKLRALHRDGDPEIDHGVADELLLSYIGDSEIADAFHAITKWYA